MSDWIKCENKMPASGEDVLLFTKHGITCGRWWSKEDGGENFRLDYADLRVDADEVTHWQPLPNPPEA